MLALLREIAAYQAAEKVLPNARRRVIQQRSLGALEKRVSTLSWRE
jgi:hypothetical protein